jgi:hypothetical protein
MIWDDSIITTIAAQGEESIATKVPCIVERISLATIAGTSLLSLPSYVIDIISVTWKGYYLDPYPMQDYIEAGSSSLNVSSSKPLYYLYNGYGTGIIKLLPAPNEILAAAVNPLTTKAEIAKRLVLEVKRTPDVSGITHRIPEYFRRRLIKDYVCYRLFLQESSGMNLKASEYYKNKHEDNLKLFKTAHDHIYQVKRHEMLPQEGQFMNRPARPVLPSNFGRSW